MITDLIEHLPSLHDENFTDTGEKDLNEKHTNILGYLNSIFSSYLQETDKYNTHVNETHKLYQEAKAYEQKAMEDA